MVFERKDEMMTGEMIKLDAHVHSTYSDGSCTVSEICSTAAAVGITHLSFTDHDTTRTYTVALETACQNKIHLIPGIEISAFDYKRNRKVHILGYQYRLPAVHINRICDETLTKRDAHSHRQLDKIWAAGYPIDNALIRRLTKDSGVLYKQFIMASITEAPFESPAYQALYRKLFKGYGIAAGDIEYCDVHDAIRAIKADGGLAVLAHPGQLDSFDLIPELVPDGLDGLELNHPDHTEADLIRIRALAEQYQLFMTGGSDFHGTFGDSAGLGCRLSPTDGSNKLITHSQEETPPFMTNGKPPIEIASYRGLTL